MRRPSEHRCSSGTGGDFALCPSASSLATAAAAASAVIVGTSGEAAPPQWSPTPWTAVHQWTPLASNITLVRRPGSSGNVTATWRILHITDAHISLSEAPDLHFSGTRRMHNAFRSVQDKHFEPGQRRQASETFKRLLRLVQDTSPDAVVLTGDIVNYPQNASVQFVLDALGSAGCGPGNSRIPTIYTAGNHDWLVEGLSSVGRAQQRTRFRREVLRPLYRLSRGTARAPNGRSATAGRAGGGGRPGRGAELEDFASLELGPRQVPPGAGPGQSLLILTLDNSMLEVSSAQAAFIWRELARGVPTLLAVHVPFMLPGVTPKNNKHVLCGDPRYGFEGDTSWHVERRERWPRGGAPASTLRFVEDLVRRFAAPRGPLLGVLGGHEHEHRADVLGKTWPAPPLRLTCPPDGGGGNCRREEGALHEPGRPLHEGLVQYVTPAACEGGHRIVEVRDARPKR